MSNKRLADYKERVSRIGTVRYLRSLFFLDGIGLIGAIIVGIVIWSSSNGEFLRLETFLALYIAIVFFRLLIHRDLGLFHDEDDAALVGLISTLGGSMILLTQIGPFAYGHQILSSLFGGLIGGLLSFLLTFFLVTLFVAVLFGLSLILIRGA